MNIGKLRREIINRVIGIEGEYSNHEDDSGGATKYGITHKTAAKHGITNVRTLSVEQAFGIYISDYWGPLKLDGICTLSAAVAEELFEQGVNMGTPRAAEFLQRILNSLNNNQRHWADVVVDGDIGSETLTALDAFFKHRRGRAERVLLNMLNSLQSVFYLELSERRPKDEAFNFGWQDNRVDLPAVVRASVEGALGQSKRPDDFNDVIRETAKDAVREALSMAFPDKSDELVSKPEPDLVLRYFVIDSTGNPLPMKVPETAALPVNEPEYKIMHENEMYPVYRDLQFKPKPQTTLRRVNAETATDVTTGAAVLGAVATGAATMMGFDTGLSVDTAAGIAAGGGFTGLLYAGLKFAAKKLVFAKLGGLVS